MNKMKEDLTRGIRFEEAYRNGKQFKMGEIILGDYRRNDTNLIIYRMGFSEEPLNGGRTK